MPHGERIEYENAYYHIMNRGRGRQQIYHGRAYYEAFIEGVAEAYRRFGIDEQPGATGSDPSNSLYKKNKSLK